MSLELRVDQDIVPTTVPVSAIQSSTQKQHLLEGTIPNTNTNNYFDISITEQASSSDNAIPGVLYIIDKQNSGFKDTEVFISTNCNSLCPTFDLLPTANLNCNNKIMQNNQDVYYAQMTAEKACQIRINLKRKDQGSQLSYKILQYPNYRMVIQFFKEEVKVPISIWWNQASLIPRYFIFKYTFVSQDNLFRIINKIKIFTVEAKIKALYFGTNNAQSTCNTKFPNADKGCKAENTLIEDQAITYQLDTLKGTQELYLSVIFVGAESFELFPNFNVVCDQTYQYDSQKFACIHQCADGQFWENAKNECTNCLNHCKVCTDTIKCIECNPKYKLQDSNKKCKLFGKKLDFLAIFFISALLFLF